MTTIYTLTDPRDLVIKYVGKSIRPEKRFIEHLKESGSYKKINWIQKLLKSGMKPIMEELDQVPTQDEDFWEIYWIAQIKSWGFDLLNHTKGGHNPPIVRKYGDDNSFKKPEVVDKIMGMNHARKGKTYEELYGLERAQQLKQATKERTQGKNNPRYGATISTETRDKIGVANSGENNGNYGKALPEWHIEILRQSRKKGEVYQYSINGELINTWKGLYEIELCYGNTTNICSCINGKRKTAMGYKWTRKKPD
jgi:hypothetical protein